MRKIETYHLAPEEGPQALSELARIQKAAHQLRSAKKQAKRNSKEK
jgi:hypothetical protein